MKRIARITLAALGAALAVTALGAPARAQVSFEPSTASFADERFDISARDARNIVLGRYPGARFVDAYAVRDSSGQVREYVVIIVTADGRRRSVRVDARSGRIVG